MANFLGEFREVLAMGKDLPTLPGVVLELHTALDNELVSHAEIAGIINRDPPLAGRLLRLANSASFNCGTPVGDVGSAIQLLGVRQVRLLCVALSVVKVFSCGRGVLEHRSFWRHSAAVARAVRELARRLGYTGTPLGQLYVGGLLHDVGLLLLDQYFPQKLRHSLDMAQDGDEPLWKIESFVLGTDHGELGGLLLGRWMLPESIVSMVAEHHHPKESPKKHLDACWLIYAAEVICGGLGPSIQIERLTQPRAESIVEIIQSASFNIDALLDDLGAQTEMSAALPS